MTKNFIKLSLLSKKNAAFALLLSGAFTLQSCGGDGSPKIKDGETTTIKESSKGTITEVEEVQPGDDFKIIDEKVIDEKSKSLAIVHYLNGKVDTLTLQKLKEESGSDPTRTALRGVLMYSLASAFFNRNMASATPNQSYYKNADAFNKSSGLRSDMEKSAVSRKVTTPGSGSKGYGSGKSFRSHGG